MARTLAQLDAAFNALLARVDAIAPVVVAVEEAAPAPVAVVTIGDKTYTATTGTEDDLRALVARKE